MQQSQKWPKIIQPKESRQEPLLNRLFWPSFLNFGFRIYMHKWLWTGAPAHHVFNLNNHFLKREITFCLLHKIIWPQHGWNGHYFTMSFRTASMKQSMQKSRDWKDLQCPQFISLRSLFTVDSPTGMVMIQINITIIIVVEKQIVALQVQLQILLSPKNPLTFQRESCQWLWRCRRSR